MSRSQVEENHFDGSGLAGILQPRGMLVWLEGTVLTERWWIILCIGLGAVQSWICRYTMISDGLSYLDIGDAYFRGDWKAAINAYWSPLYSWFLGLGLYLLRPNLWWEFGLVHLINFLIYVSALFSFRYFMHAVLRMLAEQADDSGAEAPLPKPALLEIGYSLFLWCGLVLADVGRVIPDLLVAGILFLIVGCLVELRDHHSYWKYASFGALNGAAYLGKAIMFPLGFGFLAILLFSGKWTKARISGVLLATITFLAVCGPFIYAISRAKGRFTAGDTGKLVYSALVYPGKDQVHWRGEPAGSGIALHPTRKLMDDPPVYEFAEPIHGTYPPWDDPSYWNEGTRWNFHLRAQVRVLLQSALAYEQLVMEELGLLSGALFFIFLSGDRTRRAMIANWPLLAAAGLSLGAYSMVLVIPRYVGGSLVIFWVAIFAGMRLRKDQEFVRLQKYAAAAVSITVLASVMGHMAGSAYGQLTVGAEPSGKDQITAAIGLKQMGLQAGDKVSVIGIGNLNHWARLGRFRIVAESQVAGVASREFWSAPAERRERAYECLKSTGARVVVAWEPPGAAKHEARWKQVSGTGYYAYFFSQ